MPYNLILAQRIRAELNALPGCEEKRMFGGVSFLLHGNMACGVHGEGLIVRVGPENHAAALAQPHVRPFDLTGKPMAGWVVVTPGGYEQDSDLRAWIKQGVEFAQSLPAK